MRLTKRQLKRIIREEYSRLKRRGLISETTGNERAGIGTQAENAVRRYLNMPEVIRHASSYAPSDVSDANGFGEIEVKSASDGHVSIELFDFADIKTTDMQDLRTQIEGLTGDLKGLCEDAADEYYMGFDNLIAVVGGSDLYLVPREALRLMPSAIYGYGYRNDKTIRPAAKFKIDMSKAVNLGTVEDAMAGEPMLESRYRRNARRRTRRY